MTRRTFIELSAAAATGAAIGPVAASTPSGLQACPVVVFSKIYQELKLDYAQAAELTAEAGLDGIDCPVRPGGEVLPEKVEDDLPAYVNVLARKKLSMPLLTTAITSAATPYTEKILRTASKLGIRYYRLGFWKAQPASTVEAHVKEVQTGLMTLADMNRSLGMCALFQNHSGSFGANLQEVGRVLDGLPHDVFGAAFDIGHALVVHGEDWKQQYANVEKHLKIAYFKDAKMKETWVPFGQGDIAQSGYLGRLKSSGYKVPISLHIEFDWSEKGKKKTREQLARVLRENTRTLRDWLAAA